MIFQLYTSSYDCTVRTVSFVSGSSREVFANEDGNLISSIDLPPNGHELWISDNSGGVTHVDLREEKSTVRRYGLSDNKIGSVSVNPTRTYFLLTASNSRVMKYVTTSPRIYDLPTGCLIAQNMGCKEAAEYTSGLA